MAVPSYNHPFPQGPGPTLKLRHFCLLCELQIPNEESGSLVRTQPPIYKNDGSYYEPYFPFLQEIAKQNPTIKEEYATLCVFCSALLFTQWDHYERQRPRVPADKRHYHAHSFVCGLCGVQTYRRRVKGMPVTDFPFLMSARKPASICVPYGTQESHIVVCVDCFDSLYLQKSEYDRLGVPLALRKFNWLNRAPDMTLDKRQFMNGIIMHPVSAPVSPLPRSDMPTPASSPIQRRKRVSVSKLASQISTPVVSTRYRKSSCPPHIGQQQGMMVKPPPPCCCTVCDPGRFYGCTPLSYNKPLNNNPIEDTRMITRNNEILQIPHHQFGTLQIKDDTNPVPISPPTFQQMQISKLHSNNETVPYSPLYFHQLYLELKQKQCEITAEDNNADTPRRKISRIQNSDETVHPVMAPQTLHKTSFPPQKLPLGFPLGTDSSCRNKSCCECYSQR